MNSNIKDDNRYIVLDYFRLINEKDMYGLLNMFTDDCVIYEPFSKGCIMYNDDGTEKSCLMGRIEIESFFNIVMMATDGLQYEIKFIDAPMDLDSGQPGEIIDSTPSSSSIIPVLAFMERKEEEMS